jgi:ribosomal protein S18 acetylase RimI-like enzyme
VRAVNIREASETDVDFVAWVMLAASRSQLQRGIWEYINDHTEDEALGYLCHFAVTEPVTWCHFSRFLIAEVNGAPAAALCDFDPKVQGNEAMMSAFPAVAKAAGITKDMAAAIEHRVMVVGAVEPDYAEGAWVIENVATVPEHRRRGLVDALLETALERGRDQGFALGQISLLIGNEPARRAYLKHGFEHHDEKRDAAFEAALGSPGIERLLRTL